MTRPMRVLLVEDDPADVLLITEALEHRDPDVRVTVTADGVEALEHLRDSTTCAEQAPDLIVIDLNMPRMDGRELLGVLKNDDRLKHIPAVVLTTSTGPDDVTGAYLNHANAYVTKPIDYQELTAVVGSIVNFYRRVARLHRPA